MGQFLHFLCISLCIFQATEANNPGFKARITKNGLNYANKVAMVGLQQSVLKIRIPDQSGSSSGFKYSISGIGITQFNPPASTISLASGQGLTWEMTNGYISVHGNFHYKKWFVSDGGSFDAKLSGVGFNLGIDIGTDANGRPSISSRKCTSSIGNVDFKFHGGMSWLYNLLRGQVGDKIKSMLNNQLCNLVVNAINKDAEKKLAILPVTTPLAKQYLLDYSLDKTPLFTSSYMETYHKGEVYWLATPKDESPLVAPPMGKYTNTDKMLYLFLSDYTFDTMGDVAQKHGILGYNLTAKDLPPANRVVLNTTCNANGYIPQCVGRVIPQIARKYPNAQIELRMSSTAAPKMKISPSGIAINCSGTINMFARLPGKTETPFLLTLYARMSTIVDVSMKNELLYAKIKDIRLKLKPGASDVGNVSDVLLNMLINGALKTFLIPTLNDLGMRGIPLPVTGEIKFVNTRITLVEDAVVIGTDLDYKAGRKHLDTDPSGPLKFHPRVNYV